jgi:two-component system response regulator RegX3
VRIALLEDDLHLGSLFALWFEAEGHNCTHFASGRNLITELKRETYDIIVLDWMVSDLSGEDVLRWIREHIDWHVPVLFVTQRDSEDDIVKILTAGADDYMVKPARRREMMARVTALARRLARSGEEHNQILEHGRLTIDPSTHTVSRDGKTINLTPKEFELVHFLFRNLGHIVSRGHILEVVWGHSGQVNTRTVDTHISRIRNKLGLTPDNGWQLNAIYHYGYRLEPAGNA